MKVPTMILVLSLQPAWAQTSPGSVFSDQGRYSDLAADLRARRVGDIVTIVVADRLIASTQGGSQANRKSAANARLPRLLGQPNPVGALNNLVTLQGETALDGAGSTNRSNVLTTTLSGTVVEVLPNGDLVVQATKDVAVNSENQKLIVRGVVRWADLNALNQVRSDRVSMMSIQLNGKGLVSDAIRRPNFLYRFLMGLIPF